jgi:hypothetical protein
VARSECLRGALPSPAPPPRPQAAAFDDFTARLLKLLRDSRPARQRWVGREVVLGVHRSDYMLDAPSGGFLQVGLAGGAGPGGRREGCLGGGQAGCRWWAFERTDAPRLQAQPVLQSAGAHQQAGPARPAGKGRRPLPLAP